MLDEGCITVALAGSVWNKRGVVIRAVRNAWPSRTVIADGTRKPDGDILVSVNSSIPGGYPEMESRIRANVALEARIPIERIRVKLLDNGPDSLGPE